MAEAKATLTVNVRDLEPMREFIKAVAEIKDWLSWHGNDRMWPQEWRRGNEPNIDPAKIRKVVNMMAGWNFGDEEGAKALDEVAS